MTTNVGKDVGKKGTLIHWWYLISFKTFCKCHNVPPPSKRIEKTTGNRTGI
jgi:hypothetical protein